MAACGAPPRANSCQRFRHLPRGVREMEFHTTRQCPPRQICRARTAKCELEAAPRLARKAVETAPLRAQTLARKAEVGEHLRSADGRRNLPKGMPRKMELSASADAGAKRATWTGAYSPPAPLLLSNCKEPFLFLRRRRQFRAVDQFECRTATLGCPAQYRYVKSGQPRVAVLLVPHFASLCDSGYYRHA